jgi:hypothetical protein
VTESNPSAPSARRTVLIGACVVLGQLVVCSVIGWFIWGDMLRPASRAGLDTAPLPTAEPSVSSPTPRPTDSGRGDDPDPDVQEPVRRGESCTPHHAHGRTARGTELRCVRDQDGELRWRPA